MSIARPMSAKLMPASRISSTATWRSSRSRVFQAGISLRRRPISRARGPEETLFTALQGGYVRYRVFFRAWAKLVKGAGLPGLRIHDLRHSHASWLVGEGKGLTGVQRRLGHASITITRHSSG